MQEIRCTECNKLLGKTTGELIPKCISVIVKKGNLNKVIEMEIQCTRCKKINNIEIK